MKKLSLTLILMSCIVSAFAEGHIFVEGDYGQSRASLSNSNPQITYDSGYLTDSYPLHDNHQSTEMASLQAGYEFLANKKIPAIALGLGFYSTPNVYSYSGQVIETPLNGSSLPLYTYRFNMRSSRLMAQTKFTWQLAKPIASFVELGAGEAWTHLGSYHEWPSASNGYSPLAPFQPRTDGQFAYQVGAGLAYTFNFDRKDTTYQHERIALGYRFADLGNIEFKSRNVNYPYPLKLGEYYSREMYVGWMHLF